MRRIAESAALGFPDQFDQGEVFADSARMMQQVPNRDRFAVVLHFGKIGADVVIERQLPLFGEDRDADRHELLGNGPDP